MKKFYIIIVFIFILLVSSCSMSGNEEADGAADGVAFDYFQTYKINDTSYDIYLPFDVASSLYCTHKLGTVNSKSQEWTINFIYEPIYHVDESRETKDVWNGLYNVLFNSKDLLEEKCVFDVMLFDPYSSVELEYILHNDTNQEAAYVIFNTYLPIRLVNKSTRAKLTVGIPVDVDVLLKIDDMVEDPFNDKMISWEDFLAI